MDYIVCSQKRSRPKIPMDVCQKCKRLGSCPDYAAYIQPSLFPNFKKPTRRRRLRPVRVKPEPESPPSPLPPEQLTLNMGDGV